MFDQVISSSHREFIEEFLYTLIEKLEVKSKIELADILKSNVEKIKNMRQLSRLITKLVSKATKKIVLMIDEVDKSTNNQLFLDFIGMLRSKYLLREQEEDYTFHSVILAGVHDVKNLKLKLRPDDERKYNSPWNIAVDFDVEMDFNPREISTMLKDYQQETGVEMNIRDIAEEIFYYTSGYPYLVSKLCEIINEKILPEKDDKEWTKKDVEKAASMILDIDSVNFESLIKNLENDKKLYNFIESIILDGNVIPYNRNNELINKGKMYGILENRGGIVKVHNRIYEQLIYDYMSINIKTNELINKDINFYNNKENFITSEGYLDFSLILKKFQQFIKEQYSDQDRAFLERNARLVFLAFLKPIINGKGFDFKEVQISREKRLDVVVTYLDRKYIVELKIWRGKKYHQKGLEQLVDYLDLQNTDRGYLLIFNFNENKEFKEEKIKKDNKEIMAVWV